MDCKQSRKSPISHDAIIFMTIMFVNGRYSKYVLLFSKGYSDNKRRITNMISCPTHLPSSLLREITRKGSDLPKKSFLSSFLPLNSNVKVS